MSYAELLKRTLLVVGVLLVPVLIWYLFDVILMAFGAIILAMLLRLGAQPLMSRLRVPEPVALVISGLVILFVVAGTAYLFGTRIAVELQDVVQRVAAAVASIHQSLENSDFGKFMLEHITGSDVPVASVVSGFMKVSSHVLEAVIIMVIVGIYIGAQPRHYRDGLIWLFPIPAHARAAAIIDGIGEALRLWLIGQLIEMAVIGALSAFAVWLIGVPSSLALGLIAGVGEFIPYIGPIIGAIPAILVAITISPRATLWTVLAYLVIHQIEGNLVAPLIQRRMVSIPPAVMLLGIVAITTLFGPMAIIFAAPIVVVIFAGVSLLYVRDTLGERTELTTKLR